MTRSGRRHASSTRSTSAGTRAQATDRGTLVVQGWKVADQEAMAALAERGLPDTETAVEIPIELLRHFPTS